MSYYISPLGYRTQTRDVAPFDLELTSSDFDLTLVGGFALDLIGILDLSLTESEFNLSLQNTSFTIELTG